MLARAAMEHLQDIVSTILVVAVMLAVGLDIRWPFVMAAFRRTSELWRGLAFNHVAVPAIAVACASLFGLSGPATLALVLCAALPGGPVGALMVQHGEGDLPYGVALLLSTAAINVIATPVTLALLGVEGGAEIVMRVGRVIALGVLIPLVVGLAIRARFERFAVRTQKITQLFANLLLGAIIIGMVVTRWRFIFEFEVVTLVAYALVVAATLIGGALVVGPRPEARSALSMVSGVRNIAVALLLAPMLLSPGDQLLVPLYSLFMLTIVPIGTWAVRRHVRAAASQA